MVDMKYRALRIIASLLKIAAAFDLILAVGGPLLGIAAVTIAGANLMAAVCWYPACTAIVEPWGSILVLAIGFVLAAVVFFASFGTGDMLLLLVSLEENTRHTVSLLRAWPPPQPQGFAALEPTAVHPPAAAAQPAGSGAPAPTPPEADSI